MRGLLIAGWFASLAAVSFATVEITQYVASDTPAQRTAAWHRAASFAKGADNHGADRVVSAGESKTSSTQPTQSTMARTPRRDDDSLRMSAPLGLTARPGAPEPSAAVHRWCNEIVPHARRVSMKDCLAGGFRDSGETSVQGRALVLHREPASQKPARGRVLVIGATHGDEPSTIGTGFDWMARIHRGGTAYDWYWIPVLNPDGVSATPETRVNADGVDLNRNLPTEDWKTQSAKYWKRVGFEERRFPGKTAGSEPENQWLVKVIDSIAPDVIITLHAPYGLLDYDGSFPPPKSVGRLRLHRLGIYPGSLGNFGFHKHGIPVMTLELQDAENPPPVEEADQMWGDINRWLTRYLPNSHPLRTARDDSSAAG